MNWEIETSTSKKLTTEIPLPPLNSMDLNAIEIEKKNSFFNLFLNKIKLKLNQNGFFIRLTNKEYWSSNVFFIPLSFYIVYLAIRARSPFFFSAANPAIPTGGLVGENKADISRWIPTKYRPKNIAISSSMSMSEIEKLLDDAFLKFPLIIKPTVGARGLLVKKINSKKEIQQHIQQFPTEFLIEEYIDYPVEAAVLYWRNPETNKSGISSVTVKEFLHVIGNGHASIKELLMLNPRGVLQVPRLMKERTELLASIPASNTKIIVEPIGNHCRGTKFMNFNHLISPEMVVAFDKIQANLPDCYLFRLDLKTPSVSDLQNGKNIKIMEINGVGSDPAHIYDPKFPLWGMYAAYFGLWQKIFEVSTAVHRLRGVPYMNWSQFKFFSKQQKCVEILEE
jgi:hypothetical protein